MTIRSILLALMALTLVALGQPAAAKCQLEKVAEMPVTMVGLRPMISAKINGVDVKLFIDTGAFANTLSPATAARLGLRTEALPPYIHISGANGAADMRLAAVHDFTIMGAQLHQVDFLVAEHALGPADGLIGEQMLAKFDVEYDFANGMVRLFLPKGCGSANLAYWADGTATFIPIRPAEPPSNQITGPASLNGVKIEVSFNSGANRSGVTVAAAKRAGVRTDGPGVIAVGAGLDAGRSASKAWLARFDLFQIGDEQVKNTKMFIDDFQIDTDMLIGADFFLSHHIYVARSQNRLYFTYNGGPVFNLEQTGHPPATAAAVAATGVPAAAPAGLDDPKTAEDFSRRAAASAARHEYDAAIVDDTQAIALDPNDARNYFDRGVARTLNHQPIVAMSDFDQALKLKPDDAPALMMRGELRLASRDDAGARADFTAAIKADPAMTLRVGDLYARTGRYEMAILDFDSWISARPKTEDLAGALAARCRARAMLGVELDKALRDCDDAIGYRPGIFEFLTARGLVKLRLGRLDPAVSDFNAAVRLQPKAAWALYGRGVVELRKGDKDKGTADLAAAAAIAPRLADQAVKAGIAP